MGDRDACGAAEATGRGASSARRSSGMLRKCAFEAHCNAQSWRQPAAMVHGRREGAMSWLACHHKCHGQCVPVRQVELAAGMTGRGGCLWVARPSGGRGTQAAWRSRCATSTARRGGGSAAAAADAGRLIRGLAWCRATFRGARPPAAGEQAGLLLRQPGGCAHKRDGGTSCSCLTSTAQPGMSAAPTSATPSSIRSARNEPRLQRACADGCT